MARTVPDGLTKLVFSGTLATGQENFAFGFWASGYTAGTGTGAIDLSLATTGTLWTNLASSLQVMMATGDAITALDSYWYQGNEAVAHQHQSLSVVGGGTTAIMPAQIALCITLRTALATRSGRGRMFIPVGTAGLSAATRLPASPSNINSLIDNFGLYFASFNSTSHPVVVVSQTHGTSAPVTTVDGDIVLDTQRRRRNRLSAVRHSHAAT